ncbi:hypothetical protein U1Q18_019568 [Sarracenia purpurea var. burkii]
MVDVQGIASPDLYGSETKSLSAEVKVARPGLSEVSLDLTMGKEYGTETCSTELVLGNANLGKNCLESTPSIRCTRKSSEAGVNKLINPLRRILFNGTGSISSGLTASSSDDSFNASASVKTSESPKRHRSCSPDFMNLESRSLPDSTLLSLSTHGFNQDDGQVCKKNRVHDTLHPDDKYFGCLCYKPPDLKDFTILKENGEGCPAVDDYLIRANSLVVCSTPPDLSLSISVSSSSPQSMLRNSAMSYKYTPSIIRKRSSKESDSSNSSDRNYTSVQMISCTSKAGFENMQSLLSPFYGSETSVVDRSLERRLECEFDKEWDSAAVRCCTPVTATSSSGLNFDTNMMLSP